MWTIQLIDEDAQYESRVVMLWEMGDDVVRDKEKLLQPELQAHSEPDPTTIPWMIAHHHPITHYLLATSLEHSTFICFVRNTPVG